MKKRPNKAAHTDYNFVKGRKRAVPRPTPAGDKTESSQQESEDEDDDEEDDDAGYHESAFITC